METIFICILIASAVFGYYKWLLFIRKQNEIAEKKDSESKYSYNPYEYISRSAPIRDYRDKTWLISNSVDDIIIPMATDSFTSTFTADSVIPDTDFGGGSFGGGGSGGDYSSDSSDSDSSSFSD